MDSLTAQPIAGTSGASYPFWSPDGQQIGFFAESKLRKVPASGGTVVTLCDAEDGRGASWNGSGTIVFAPNAYGGLMQVPSAGGAPSPVTTLPAEGMTHRLPHFLPDGKRLLFFSSAPEIGNKDNGIWSLDLASKKTALVLQTESEGLYAEPGYLLFVRDENLMAQPIDPGTMRVSGEAVPVAEKVSFNSFRFTGAYTISRTGLLLYQTGAAVAKSQLTWFDLEGKKLATVGEPASFPPLSRPTFSPDGQRAAVAVQAAEGKVDLWSWDLARAVATRLTFGPGTVFFPVWSRDGREIVYSDTSSRISAKAADGASEPRVLVTTDKSARTVPLSFSPDGSFLAYRQQGGKTRWDIWILPLKGDGKPYPFIASPASENLAEFSPDGRWLLYASDESGKPEVFVVPFPGPGGKRQISSGGASLGFWMPDGREIVYVTPARKLIAVQVTASGTNLEIGASHALFGGQPIPAGPGRLAPDGKRYLAEVPLDEAVAPPITLVTNWAGELAGK
jgi:eukaryotic-like serine/threonine-protein kinase